MSSAENWPEATCSSHRWRGLILITQHVNKKKPKQSSHRKSTKKAVVSKQDVSLKYWSFSSVWSAVVFPCVQGGYRSSHSHPRLCLCWGCVGAPPAAPISLLSTPWCFHPAFTLDSPQSITPGINPTVQVLIRRQNSTEGSVNLFLLRTPDLLLTKCFLLCVHIRLDCKCPSELGAVHLLISYLQGSVG